MKNEPLMTYDHIRGEDHEVPKLRKVEDERESLPISLYMLLVVDAVLISAILFITFKIIL